MAVIALLAAVLLALAPSASARVHAVIPANADGPNDTFATNENLWATGTANPLEGSNQLCVVEASSGPAGTCKQDKIWGQPNVIAVTGTYLQPIDPAPLPVGTYRILADNGDDADGQDVISEPFYVVPCTGTPDDCDPDLATGELRSWKDAAGETLPGMGIACLAMIVHTQDAKDLAVSALTSDKRTFIVGQLQDNASVELEFNVPQSTQDLAKGLLRHVACGAYLAYSDIFADPPDPDFEHVTEPRAAQLPTSGMTAADDATTAMERLRANAVAQRIAVERHQGAIAGDDQGWAAFHATTAAETGFVSGREARRSVDPLRTAALELEADISIQPATDAAVQRARDIHARIAESGFTPGERADLEALGVAPSELAALREEMGRPLPPGTGGVHPADALRAAADSLEASSCHAAGSSCAFDEFAQLAGAVGGNTAVPPRIEIPDVTLREGDRGRNHVTVPLRLSHPATAAVGGTITGDLPAGVTLAPGTPFSFAARTLRTVLGFEVTNDDTEAPDRTAELGVTVAGPAATPEPFTLSVTDDDDAPAPRPGGTGRLAFSRGLGNPTVFIAEPNGGDVEQIYENTGADQLHPEDWSGDGRFLLMHRWTLTASDDEAGGRPYYALPVGENGHPSGAKVRLTPEGNGLYEGASWSRDGKWLSFIVARSFTWSLSLQRLGPNAVPSGEMIDASQDDPDLANIAWFDGTSWSPDGDRLAFAGCETGYHVCGVYVVDVADGEVNGPPRPVVRMRYRLGEDADLPSWSPDGRFLAYRVREADGAETVQRVAVDDAGTPQGPPVTLTSQRIEVPVRWAPDTRAITFASTEHPLSDAPVRSGVVVELDAAGRPTGGPRFVTPLAFAANVLSWGPPVPDVDAPVATASLDKAANASGWHRDPVVTRLRAVDSGGDGVESITYTLDGKKLTATGAAADVTLSADGVHTLSYFATDRAGNASAPKSLVVRLDRTAPGVAIGSPGAGATHVAGASVAAAYSCSDGGSGVVGCDGSTPAGGRLDTDAPGARTLQVTARDRAGNATTADRSWSVVAALQPVEPIRRTEPAKATPAATLPSSRRCVSRRRFRIRLARPSGDPLRSADVFIGSKRVRRISGRKLTAPIDLRGLPKGKFKVRVIAKTRAGRTLSVKRTYRTCVPKRRR